MCDEDVGTQDCALAMEVADEETFTVDTEDADLDDLYTSEVTQEDLQKDVKHDPDELSDQCDADNTCTNDSV